MTRTLKPLTAALLIAAVAAAAAWSRAQAADDPHQHGTTAPPAAVAPPAQPNTEAPSSLMPQSAEDMLRAMETMHAHDDESCCGTRKSDSAKTLEQPRGGHNH